MSLYSQLYEYGFLFFFEVKKIHKWKKNSFLSWTINKSKSFLYCFYINNTLSTTYQAQECHYTEDLMNTFDYLYKCKYVVIRLYEYRCLFFFKILNTKVEICRLIGS